MEVDTWISPVGETKKIQSNTLMWRDGDGECEANGYFIDIYKSLSETGSSVSAYAGIVSDTRRY